MKYAVLVLLALAPTAHALDWGTQWDWHSDSLTVEWTGAPVDGPTDVSVLVRSYSGHEFRVRLSHQNLTAHRFTLDGYPGVFYCGAHVSVTITAAGQPPRVVEHDRPEQYPPRNPKQCTRSAPL